MAMVPFRGGFFAAIILCGNRFRQPLSCSGAGFLWESIKNEYHILVQNHVAEE
jgi:hypothetical protein